MQANPNEDLEREYQNLTEKQRAVIDAHAQNPDETNREKARIAGEEMLGQDGPINESYASEILNKDYGELAKYREEIEQNERPEGTQQTVGDPFEELQQQQSEGYQAIQERPVKSVQTEEEESAETAQQPQVQPVQRVQNATPIQVGDTGDGIVIKLSYRYVEDLIENPDSNLPAELHRKIVNVLFQQAGFSR